jgi:hypothetical protein
VTWVGCAQIEVIWARVFRCRCTAFVDAPGGVFDPDAVGEYNFAIQVSRSGFGVETVAMDVQVVPEPGTALLMGLGLVGLAACRVARR